MSHVLPFTLVLGQGPLILSIPHLGQHIPDELADSYTPQARLTEDADWHLDRLYAFAEEFDATVLSATVSRYVIDLNRPATGESLYPGMITTSLCPTESFRGSPLYKEGREPSPAEVARRVDTYWKPYHQALQEQIARLRAEHGHILLWEAHSIASVLPRLFPGKLNDLNFGTSDGESCSEAVIAGAVDAVRDAPWSWVVNGRFKGGYITRRYGKPKVGVHAVQLEMCQSLYMEEEPPFAWRADRADAVAPTVRAAVQGALNALPQPAPSKATDILSG